MNKIIKNQKSKIVNCLAVVLFTIGCSDFLDLQPTDKVTADAIFSSEAGIEAFLANLYYKMPIEDWIPAFNWFIDYPNNNGNYEWTATDDGIHSSDYFSLADVTHEWWEAGYQFNKDVNLFFSYIPTTKSITEDTRKLLYGEAYYLRAITYFTLARRYGGVPIITSISEITDTVALYKQRSTEKETWDFALANCDTAAMYLGDDAGNKLRLNKWTALALKSRMALHAASVAKYWNKAPLSGRAVDEKLVGGFTQADALNYYQQCIDAAGQIIDDGKFSLYKPLPATPQEATENYRQMFEFPANASEEIIFMRGYDRIGTGYGSNQDVWCNPAQTAGAWPHPGRVNPTLGLVDTYESYSNPGKSAPIVTTTDGNTTDYSGYNPSRVYLTFDDPLEIFSDKDARLHATVILPSSMWKNTKIIIQGGYIQPNGKAVIGADESIKVDGVTYYTYGASSPVLYSGFASFGQNYTRTGFGFKKFLSTTFVPAREFNQSTTDWIEFRYAEVLLDYAEAVVESGLGVPAKAAKAMNDLRKRAAHKTDIPLTLENVLRERRVELVYERGRTWDLFRRRMAHEIFNNSCRSALVPVLDLRNMKYIFIRQHCNSHAPNTFIPMKYYEPIPGTANNRLVQNPQY